MSVREIVLEVVSACDRLAVPAIALIVCLKCRRHRVRLCPGGLFGVATWSWVVICPPVPNGDHGSRAVVVQEILALAAAALILLVGGLVRRSQARQRGRSGPAGDQPEPTAGR